MVHRERDGRVSFLSMRVEEPGLNIFEKREGNPPLLILVVVAHAEVQYPVVAEVVEDVLVVDVGHLAVSTTIDLRQQESRDRREVAARERELAQHGLAPRDEAVEDGHRVDGPDGFWASAAGGGDRRRRYRLTATAAYTGLSP